MTSLTPTKKQSVFRTNYFIYPKFQLALLLANVLAWLGFLFITLAFVTSSGREMTELGKAAGFASDHVYFRFLDMQRQALVMNILTGAAIALVFSSTFFVWFSHRVVGPLFNLNRYLSNYVSARAKGETLPPLKFRKNDLFQEIATGVNAALDAQPVARKD